MNKVIHRLLAEQELLRQPHTQPEPGLNAVAWRDLPIPDEALYDLVFDPNETNNLADKTAAQTVLQNLKDCMEGWMRDTDDPLLKGAVPAPPEAVVTDADSLSPRPLGGRQPQSPP